MVVLCHIRYLTESPQAFSTLVFYFNSGVDIFFALSGFLITKKYIHRIEDLPDIPQFYKLRWARTLPLYAFVGLFYLGFQFPDLGNLIYYITFTQNYFAPDSWYISWSLCVEEWFYLLYAPLIYSLKRFRLNFSFVVLFLALISLLYRIDSYYQASPSAQWFKDDYYGLTHMRFDGLLIGCFFGSLRPRQVEIPLLTELFFPLALVLVATIPLTYLDQASRIDIFSAAYLPFISATLTSIWLWLFWNSKLNFWGKFVETTYLIHLPVISALSKLKLPFLASAPIALICTFLLSILLYLKFETKAQRLILKSR